MTQQKSPRQASQYVLAFVAAGLFYLAGMVEFLVRDGLSASIGAMFICIASLWVVIGMKFKKEGN